MACSLRRQLTAIIYLLWLITPYSVVKITTKLPLPNNCSLVLFGVLIIYLLSPYFIAEKNFFPTIKWLNHATLVGQLLLCYSCYHNITTGNVFSPESRWYYPTTIIEYLFILLSNSVTIYALYQSLAKRQPHLTSKIAVSCITLLVSIFYFSNN